MNKIYKNDKGPVEKDEILAEIIPKHITNCSLIVDMNNTNMASLTPDDVFCITSDTVNKITTALNVDSFPSAMKKLGCTTEKCILHKMQDVLDTKIIKFETARLKIPGPTDTTLLSNFNIDDVLHQWMVYFDDFFAYNFNMRNYMDYSIKDNHIVNTPDTLATINFVDLYCGVPGPKKYKCAACVINTDVYQGVGKHWMALFVDCRLTESANLAATVEFFNSSGNAPAPEWISFLVKTKAQLELINIPAEIIKVTNIRHQQSKSECGVYSLFYIWARLNRVPYSYFQENPIPDQIMFEFRQHLFKSDKFNMKEFDYKTFIDGANVKWEKN